MKIILTMTLLGILYLNTTAQAPEKMSYQAVVRDASGELVTNQLIGMKVSILQGSATGPVVYSETYSPNPQTNANGLVTVDIGSGVPVSGTFAGIDWASGPYFLRVETDTQGGTAYQITGTSQLLSVPYAFYAETAGNGFSGNYEDLINKPVWFDGTWTSLTGIPGDFSDGVDHVDDADNSITNEIQVLNLAGSSLSLSKEGGTVTIPGDNWGTQTVATDATLSGSGSGSSPLKIAQQSASSGQVLKWNGTSWQPSNDETGSGSNPFVSLGGITRNSFLSDHFVFGSSSLDGLEGSEDNKRMFFNKPKGAFRAGDASGTGWDDANVGLNSAAFGEGPIASGIVSFAAGRFTLASGIYSTALGAGTYAIGMASTAMGGSTKATGEESTSMGYNTVAAAKSSVALGRYNLGAGSGFSWVESDPVLEIGIGSSDTEKANAMTVLKNGNMGIGTASPAALLHTEGTGTGKGNVVFAGQYKTTSPGSPPVSGVGTRMMWYPDKAAFRAGQITGAQWDKDSIGNYSVSMGYNTIATGPYSTAIGESLIARTLGETVFGMFNTDYRYTNASYWIGSDRLFVVGNGMDNTNRSNALTILKNGNTGIGTAYPAALLDVRGMGTGEGNVLFTGSLKSTPGDPPATGAGTRLMWYPDKAAFRAGIVAGNQWDKENIGWYSVAMGYNTKASANYSVAMGFNTTASSLCETVIGCNNVVYTPADVTVWNGNDRLFVIGNGLETPGGSNALTVLKNGNVGIGPVNPSVKLEVGGQVKITGGSPGLGKVLTSDANGLASWQTPVDGLTLPYTGSVSTTGDQAFFLWNTGTGNGIYVRSNEANGLVGQSQGGVKTSGVKGLAYGSGENSGVSGSSNSTLGTGVSGSASSLTGSTIGVSGLVISPDGYSGFFDGGKFYISGNAGIGVTAPSTKLDVNGQVKIRGGSPGAGKVLTSDAAGLAVWAAPEELKLPYSDTVSTPFPLISICNSGSGNGLLAISKYTTGTTCGIAGEAYSTLGAGLIGTSYATTGSNYGVKGKTYSADGYSGYFDGGKFYISGKTGLGTTAPSQRLHVKGDVPGNAVVLIEPNKWEAAGDYGELRFGDANHTIRGEHTTGMTFNDANKFTFTGGNVGIGTGNPSAKLDISASQGPNLIIRDSDGGAGRPGIQFVNNDVHFIGSDDTSTEIFGFYSRYGDTRTNAAKLNIHGPATGNWGKYIGLTHDGNHGRISTDAGYLVLEPAGNRVGLGTDAPTQSLDVNGTLRVRGMTTGTSAGTVYRTGDGTLITGASDVRLKDNIEPLENSLDKILQLHGVTFSWKSDPESRRNVGFIAQDFEKVIPELVFTNETDGYKGINYAEVSAVIVEAMKEQQKIIEELRTENSRLKAEQTTHSNEIRQMREEIKRIFTGK